MVFYIAHDDADGYDALYGWLFSRNAGKELAYTQLVCLRKRSWEKMNYTKHTLQKIEELIEELGYTVRYEKGSFQSGYCLVENNKIVVINRFFETEGRINTLIDIIDKIEINTDLCSEKGLKTYKEIRKIVKS